jgi:hypothetical protein
MKIKKKTVVVLTSGLAIGICLALDKEILSAAKGLGEAEIKVREYGHQIIKFLLTCGKFYIGGKAMWSVFDDVKKGANVSTVVSTVVKYMTVFGILLLIPSGLDIEKEMVEK